MERASSYAQIETAVGRCFGMDASAEVMRYFDAEGSAEKMYLFGGISKRLERYASDRMREYEDEGHPISSADYGDRYGMLADMVEKTMQMLYDESMYTELIR